MLDFVRDIAGFLGNNKKYWLIPFFLVLAVAAIVVIAAETTAVSPFVYTLF